MVRGDFSEEKRLVFRNLDRIVGGVLLALVALYLASGVYVVQAKSSGSSSGFRLAARAREVSSFRTASLQTETSSTIAS